ncbi:hypothetical protein MKK75_03785 [Methylobacterium sp. J-030]|uniref:hypothetical protein n=1 Tax=Methylobacterium sp. J-030 TaxID=2836627 RepID=UPI001FBBF8B7|nr:hypothetical protein [Methylobacterium sp. J-030]MCJ2067936.1 hypothetical protein [Methylobacterium sp. J-030]
MSKMLKELMAIAQREDATSAELVPALPLAEAELRAAYLAQQEAEQAYTDNLLNPDDTVLPRLMDARRAAGMRADRVKAVRTALQGRLAAVQEADRRTEVDQLHVRADEAAEAYRNAVSVDLPLVIEAVRGMLRLGAEAEIARKAAMEADPTRAPRQSIDAFRASPDRPRKELSKARELELWVRPNGDHLVEDLQADVRLSSDGTGFLLTGSGSTRFNHRRKFRRVEVLDAEFGRAAEPLTKVLSVPGLGTLDNPGWRPLERSDPHAILTALDRLERQVVPEGDTRQPRVEYQPIGNLIEVGRANSVIEDLANRRAS